MGVSLNMNNPLCGVVAIRYAEWRHKSDWRVVSHERVSHSAGIPLISVQFTPLRERERFVDFQPPRVPQRELEPA